ncbi:hypothetical protein AB0D71_34010 [Streptomyces avermitilis]
MGIEAQFATFSSPSLALLTALFAVALANPEPQARTRAERILAVIFRAR